ncbi:unnamed protein product [Thelazia callipaeda]|uniref:Transcription initiation factor TFIID subunit 7 n=1 Tax=Thelazia callipaeda TaxID=103827 RepID=A0A0N5CRA4_THECL|nr:unnamed protein product [Thelazia callipaeda]
MGESETQKQPKKRGRKRLSDGTITTKKRENAKSMKNEAAVDENLSAKKRGRKRKRKAEADDITVSAADNSADNKFHLCATIMLVTFVEIKGKQAPADKKEKKKREKKKKAKNESNAKDASDAAVIKEPVRSNAISGRSASLAKKQCLQELLDSQKMRTDMAYPKGTFLIRYADLETLDSDPIWCVDNHHMLIKYRLSNHIEGKHRLYFKSHPERFIGWKCDEPWHFLPVTVIERDQDSNRVMVIYPDAKELAEQREKARRQRQIAQELKRSGNCQDSHGQSTNKLPFVADEEAEDGVLTDNEDYELEMAEEAAMAIENFIMIPEGEYDSDVDGDAEEFYEQGTDYEEEEL